MRFNRSTAFLLVALFAGPLTAAEHHAPLHTFKSTNPPALWDALIVGNDRYVAGHLVYNTLRARRDATRDHQQPPVTILSCSDSRVPPELIFDRTVGDLFIIRVAGNTADDFGMASIEYAVAMGYTKLIVVMGHERCGAVDAALAKAKFESPYLTALVARISESFATSHPHDLREAIDGNTRFTAEYLTAHSAVIRDAVRDGKITIVTAFYGFDGHVTKLH
jgi:carbonic anhydrase